MPPPMERADEERLLRIFNRMLDDRLGPVEVRSQRHSKQLGAVREEVSPAVAKKISESQHEIVDREQGFERVVLQSMADFRAELSEIKGGLQPRAIVELDDGKGGKSILPASLVAAQSSVRTEQKQEVIANKQDTIGTMVLNAALETTAAKDNSAATKTRATGVMIAAFIITVIEIWRMVSPFLTPAVTPHQ